VKTHYEIIGVAPTASADEIKRKFRQEIARYHPDKVQHLGKEFQELASARAAELTQAYRVLMDEQQRAEYDAQIAGGMAAHGAASPAPSPESPPAAAAPPVDEPRVEERPAAARFQKEQATRDDFVRSAAVARFREAVEIELDGCQSLAAKGFDAGYLHRPKRGLFKKSDTPVRVLGRFVAQVVDSAALHEAWAQAIKAPAGDAPQSVVFLMGNGLAPARELAGAIAEERRKSRAASAVTLIPVDVRDWQALIPTDAPPLVKPLLQRLRTRG